MTASSSWVTALRNPTNKDAGRVGGKAAQLCRLTTIGMPVPPAFVVNIDAFRAHFADCTINTPPAPPRVDARLREQLHHAFDELTADPQGTIAVRSSALGEDGQAHSFAGQHATYYYVGRGELEQAVVNCWLSLWSPAALAYRARLAQPVESLGMAVVLQRMVQAQSSGVCFTQDPTGQLPGHALVEATWGLGASLVDGRVSPDRFFVAPNGTVASRRIARKRYKVAENLHNGSAERLDQVPTHQQIQPAISDQQLAAVVDLARRVERHYDQPQDVEWAFERGELHLLQSRPITACVTLPTVEGRWVLFKPVIENFHEPLTPMTVDLYRRALPGFGRFIDGRYYIDFDQIKRFLPFKVDDATLAQMLLLRGNPPDVPVQWSRLPGCLLALMLAYLTTGVTWHRTARLTTTGLWRFATLAERVKRDEQHDALSSLYRLVVGRHPLEPIGHRIFQANVSAGRYFILLDLLKRFLGKFAPQVDQALLEQVCTGNEDMLTRQLVDGVRNLAELAQADEHTRALLEQPPTSTTAGSLGELPESHPFVIALEEFLAAFGHRCVKELELSAPRWREEPLAVLALARNHLGVDAAERTSKSYGVRLAALDQLHQALASRWQRWIVDYLISRIRYYVTLRENTRHFHCMAFDVLRTKLKRTEQTLLDSGQLKCPDDIFFLTWNETTALGKGELTWTDVEPVVRARRRLHNERSRGLPPSTLNLPLPASQPTGSENHLLGQCASPGYAEGTIKVVLDPTLGAGLEAGDILVAPYTDPAWTPLFPGAAAIVVEVGSYLSHAGTVAREYQIPCLVDVANCTRDLRSGQRARVYATEGRLEIVE